MEEQEIIDHWLNMNQQQPIQLATQDAYWQQVRIQAAIAAMQSIADSLGSIDYNKELIAKHAVELADALVEELKHSEDVYAECRRMDAINTASVCENMTKIQNELQKKGGKQ